MELREIKIIFFEANWNFGLQDLIQIISAILTLVAIIVALYLGIKKPKEKIKIIVANLKYDKKMKMEEIKFIVLNNSTIPTILSHIVVTGKSNANYDFLDSIASFFISEPNQPIKNNDPIDIDIYSTKRAIELPLLLDPGKAIELYANLSYESESEFYKENAVKFIIATLSKTYNIKKKAETDNGWIHDENN